MAQSGPEDAAPRLLSRGCGTEFLGFGAEAHRCCTWLFFLREGLGGVRMIVETVLLGDACRGWVGVFVQRGIRRLFLRCDWIVLMSRDSGWESGGYSLIVMCKSRFMGFMVVEGKLKCRGDVKNREVN